MPVLGVQFPASAEYSSTHLANPSQAIANLSGIQVILVDPANDAVVYHSETASIVSGQLIQATEEDAVTFNNLNSLSVDDSLSCIVTLPNGSARPAFIVLVSEVAANATMEITTAPVNTSVEETNTATFTSVGTGQDSIQWFLNDVAISGANSASYTTPFLSLASNGDVYRVDYIKAGLNTVSATATLTVTAQVPPVTLQDQSLVAITGSPYEITLGPELDTLGNVIVYTATVTGSATLSSGSETNLRIFDNAVSEQVTISVTGDNQNGATDTATITVTSAVLASTTQFFTTSNNTFTTPEIQSFSVVSATHYFKVYGHDDAIVNPHTGQVTWDIEAGFASESMHVGVAAYTNSSATVYNYIIHIDKGANEVWTIGGGINDDYTDWEALYDSGNFLTGHTVIFKNGDHSGYKNQFGRQEPEGTNNRNTYPPVGTPTSFTCILGEVPGSAVFINGAGFNINLFTGLACDYIKIGGLFAKGTADGAGGSFRFLGYSNGTERPTNIKIIYCLSQGGDSDREPIYFSRASRCLVESCAMWGGGRYKSNTYRCDEMIFRRSIYRNDRAADAQNNPKGSQMFYTTMDYRSRNSIDVDSDKEEFIASGIRVGAWGTPVTVGDTRGQTSRAVQVNSEQRIFNFDNQVSSAGGMSLVEAEDIAAYDVRPDFAMGYSWGAALLDGCTFVNVHGRYAGRDFVHTREGTTFEVCLTR